MSEIKHTAGPWHVCFTRIGKEVIYWHVADSKRGTLNAIACADEGLCKEFPSVELEANGRLIAAAPDMAEALRFILAAVTLTSGESAVVVNALRKAGLEDQLTTE